jgi:histidine ammonia-lyase
MNGSTHCLAHTLLPWAGADFVLVKSMEIDGETLTVADVIAAVRGRSRIRLSDDSRARMSRSRELVERALAASRPVYGINTGFGGLADVRIPPEDLARLQVNKHAYTYSYSSRRSRCQGL